MNDGTIPPAAPHDDVLHHPRTRAAFRATNLLLGCYLGVSVLTLTAIALLRDDAAAVTDAVWIRACIVVISALLALVCGVRASWGSRPAYRRLRLISGIMVVAIAVIIVIPGAFPPWMKAEQGICGALLLGVVAVVNGNRLRSVFSTGSA